ncbi:hypothetical protein BJ944DRAFT_261223 [Cunninghamella echinulata]|nr:hypothetical protein BJ944DRAFT_261223 [Cunninghamella echinulata]
MKMASDEPQVNEPRKKRVKIVSACGECRRRKTKCNGETPCYSCRKASVECIYPTISHAEDKRNNLSKAALESIEDRLKAIEDMLRLILQSQPFPIDLPTNNNKDPTSPGLPLPRHFIQQQQQQPSSNAYVTLPPPSTTTTSPPNSLPLPVHHHHHTFNNNSNNKNKILSSSAPSSISSSTSSPDVRLPSIHNLSSYNSTLTDIKQESFSINEVKKENLDDSTNTISTSSMNANSNTTDLLPRLDYYATTANNCRTEISPKLSEDKVLAAFNKKRKRS